MEHPTTQEQVDALLPWSAALCGPLIAAEVAQLEATSRIGIPRPVERAGIWHCADRSYFRHWCDETNGQFRMSEEKEGRGLDCMICSLITDKPFAVRWGRIKDGIIKRNDSQRQSAARKCGRLSSEFMFPGLEETAVDELSQITLAYSIADDRTEGGMPAWYMDKVILAKELFDGVDQLAVIATFDPPASIIDDERRVVAVPRREELQRWRKAIGEAARKHG